MEVTLKSVGGVDSLVDLLGDATADAVINALFMAGPDDGGTIVGEAIERTDPSISENNKWLDGPVGPRAWSALQVIALKKETIDAFRNHLIDVHIKKHRDKYPKEPGALKRIEHFRDPWP